MREDPQLPQVSKDEAIVPGDKMHTFRSDMLIMCIVIKSFAFCTSTNNTIVVIMSALGADNQNSTVYSTDEFVVAYRKDYAEK